jgi:hypothetical protein
MENKKPAGRRELLPATVTTVQNKLKGALKIGIRPKIGVRI